MLKHPSETGLVVPKQTNGLVHPEEFTGLLTGWDMDDTLWPHFAKFFEFLKSINYHRRITLDNLNKPSIENTLEVDYETGRQLMWRFWKSGLYLNTSPFAYAPEVLRTLSKVDRQKLITSRPMEQNELITVPWIESYIGKLDEIFVLGVANSRNHQNRHGGSSKDQIAREDGLDVVVEEDPDHVMAIADSGINVLMKVYKYNQHLKEHPKVHPFRSFKQVPGILQPLREAKRMRILQRSA